MEYNWIVIVFAVIALLLYFGALFFAWYLILKERKRGVLLAGIITFISMVWTFAFQWFSLGHIADLPWIALWVVFIIYFIDTVRKSIRRINKTGKDDPAIKEEQKSE